MTRPQVSDVSRSPAISLRGRGRLQALLLRELAFGAASHARIRVGDTLVELGDEGDFAIDWKALCEVMGSQPYSADYRDAAVLDIGAHKGYFGAYALARGATFVASYEPSVANFAHLSRAAAPVAGRWIARNVAVSGVAGEGVLHLDETSWAHSLIRTKRPAGEQSVSLVTLDEALADLPTGAARRIVKIDAEGSEWDILGHEHPLDVDLLLVECHPAVTGRSEEELIATVTARGLAPSARDSGVLRFERQDPTPARSHPPSR